MKHVRRIVFALSTLLAVFAYATPASASNLFVDVFADCQGYTLRISADVEGDIKLWGDAGPAVDTVVGHVVPVPGGAIEFRYRRTAGTYRPGVTILFANGKIASKGSDADPIVVVVPSCPTPTSIPTTTTTAVEATTTTSSPATTASLPPTSSPPTSVGGEVTTTTSIVCPPRRREDEPAYIGCPPPVPGDTATSIAQPRPTLPRTGAGSPESIAWYATGIVALGVLLCVAGVVAPRRPRH